MRGGAARRVAWTKLSASLLESIILSINDLYSPYACAATPHPAGCRRPPSPARGEGRKRLKSPGAADCAPRAARGRIEALAPRGSRPRFVRLDPSSSAEPRRTYAGSRWRARKGARNRDRAAALRIRRGDSGRRPRPGDRDRPNIWRPPRGGAQTGRNLGQLRPHACEDRDRKLRLRRQFEGRAASPVAIDEEAMRGQNLRRGGRGVQHRPSPLQLVLGLAEGARPGRPHAAERDSLRRQPLVGVVGAQRQPELRSRREHAIGLTDPVSCEVVDHHPEIGFGAVEGRQRPAAGLARRIDSRHRRPAPPPPRSRSCR